MKLAAGAIAVLALPWLCGVVLARGATALTENAIPPARAGAAGGLSLAPQIVEHRARVGVVGTIAIANTTSRPLRIRMLVRPWSQARTGTVAPDPRGTLTRLVKPSPSSFVLASGARRSVTLRLSRHPSGGSLYGAIDVMGIPQGSEPANGISPRYRLIGSLRLDPARPSARLQAGRPKVTGRTGRHAIVVPVRNRGNTVQPIAGEVALTGPRGTRANRLETERIVPRRTVDLTLGTYRGLLRGQPRGRYRIAVLLTQGGLSVFRATWRVTLR